MSLDFRITGFFPSPVYNTKRDSNLDSTEKKEIENIIKEGLRKTGALDHYTDNTYIFNTKLKNLKEFCEQHIKNYVKEVFNPKEEIDFYITQSWINVIEPGGNIQAHWHSNSIISGVFYISAEEGDTITFGDPNMKLKDMIQFDPIEYNIWNTFNGSIPSRNNELILFPSWLEHSVNSNEKATTDRISISFNTFAKGIFGDLKNGLNELTLK